MSNPLQGALFGGIIGSVFGPVGAVAGAALGSVIGNERGKSNSGGGGGNYNSSGSHRRSPAGTAIGSTYLDNIQQKERAESLGQIERTEKGIEQTLNGIKPVEVDPNNLQPLDQKQSYQLLSQSAGDLKQVLRDGPPQLGNNQSVPYPDGNGGEHLAQTNQQMLTSVQRAQRVIELAKTQLNTTQTSADSIQQTHQTAEQNYTQRLQSDPLFQPDPQAYRATQNARIAQKLDRGVLGLPAKVPTLDLTGAYYHVSENIERRHNEYQMHEHALGQIISSLPPTATPADMREAIGRNHILQANHVTPSELTLLKSTLILRKYQDNRVHQKVEQLRNNASQAHHAAATAHTHFQHVQSNQHELGRIANQFSHTVQSVQSTHGHLQNLHHQHRDISQNLTNHSQTVAAQQENALNASRDVDQKLSNAKYHQTSLVDQEVKILQELNRLSESAKSNKEFTKTIVNAQRTHPSISLGNGILKHMSQGAAENKEKYQSAYSQWEAVSAERTRLEKEFNLEATQKHAELHNQIESLSKNLRQAHEIGAAENHLRHEYLQTQERQQQALQNAQEHMASWNQVQKAEGQLTSLLLETHQTTLSMQLEAHRNSTQLHRAVEGFSEEEQNKRRAQERHFQDGIEREVLKEELKLNHQLLVESSNKTTQLYKDWYQKQYDAAFGDLASLSMLGDEPSVSKLALPSSSQPPQIQDDTHLFDDLNNRDAFPSQARSFINRELDALEDSMATAALIPDYFREQVFGLLQKGLDSCLMQTATEDNSQVQRNNSEIERLTNENKQPGITLLQEMNNLITISDLAKSNALQSVEYNNSNIRAVKGVVNSFDNLVKLVTRADQTVEAIADGVVFVAQVAAEGMKLEGMTHAERMTYITSPDHPYRAGFENGVGKVNAGINHLAALPFEQQMEVGAQVLTDLTVIPFVANAVVGKVANLLREVPVGVVSDAVRSETTLTHLAETSKATSSLAALEDSVTTTGKGKQVLREKPLDPRTGSGPRPVELLKAPDGGSYSQWLAKPVEPFAPVQIDPAKTLSGKGLIDIAKDEIHTAGKHFDKHGRKMGYASKKEYDAAAREFANLYQNHPDAILKEGRLNIGDPKAIKPLQRVIEYDGISVVLEVETGKLKNFYDGHNHTALIDVVRVNE